MRVVGKKIGSAIYFHKYYAMDIIPIKILERAEIIGQARYINYDIIKWDNKKKTVSFIYCPCFNDDPFPEVLFVRTVNYKKYEYKDRDYQNGDNPPIYHKKWLMVQDTYHGFDVEEAKKISAEVEKIIVKHRIDRKRIGFRKYWEEKVEPWLIGTMMEIPLESGEVLEVPSVGRCKSHNVKNKRV